MKLKNIKLLLIVLLSFVYAPNLSAAEDVDWVWERQPIHETDANSAITGTRWAIGSRIDDVQITFRLEVQIDMKKGGWIGDIRSSERFYVNISFVDEHDNENFLNVKNSKAVGPDTFLGGWKEGPTTSEEQMLIYDFSWDKLSLLKKSKSIILSYASYDSPDSKKNITFPLDTFNARLDEVEVSIGSVDGGQAYLMSKEEMNNTPIIDMPLSMQENWQAELQRVSSDLSTPVDELMKLSKNGIELLIKKKAKEKEEARVAEIRKAHQAIYDQEPDWLDMNICPKPDVSYCDNIGKTASVVNKWFPDVINEYGEIFAVVWRSKGSIVGISGGSAKYDIEPKISTASEAQYFYVAKDDSGIIDLVACKIVNPKP